MVQKNNLIGKLMKLARIAQRMKRQDVLEKIRENGIELYPTGFSNMERQTRHVLDFELGPLADALHVSVDWLLGRKP